jgi:predicted HTH domain antitoxin
MMKLPEKASLALKVPTESLGHELLLAAAVKLYELGTLSSGAVAELARVPKPLFLAKLAVEGRYCPGGTLGNSPTF